MDNQPLAGAQIPQFDPNETPTQPVDQPIIQPQTPGVVVDPAADAGSVVDQTLSQLEQSMDPPAALPLPPPPPFGTPETPVEAVANLPTSDDGGLPMSDDAANDELESQLQGLDMPDDTPAEEAPAEAANDEPVLDEALQGAEEEEAPEEVAEEAADTLDEAVDPSTVIAEPVVPQQPELVAGSDPELVAIKKQALQELAPIAGFLDQPPLDKFHTLLELIQATDDHTLVQKAFEAAQSVEDDKDRAGALLNLVNEVNYLEKTSQEASQQS